MAVLRLKMSLNLVGCCTGRSPGFSPRRMRSTYSAVLPEAILEVVTVGDEPTGHDGSRGGVDRRQAMPQCQRDDEIFVGPGDGMRERR